MSTTDSQCEICGRGPARYACYTAHQGFVFFRREINVSGMFCRDCSVEAFYHARGISLKGMWFSTSSLLFGSVSTLWNSVKQLDLPPEVKDAPWVWHKFACPTCQKGIRQLAGNDQCQNCNTKYSVVSCVHCKSVNVYRTDKAVDETSVTCRCCRKRTDAPTAGRNAPVLLLGRMLAEIAGTVEERNASVPIDHWLAAFTSEFPLADATVAWLWEQFERRAKDRETKLLRLSFNHDQTQAMAISFHFAANLHEATQRPNLRRLLERFGFTPDDFLADDGPESSERLERVCQILGVEGNASLQEIEKAYRKLARVNHPDMVHSRGDAAREAAATRMKEINRAFEIASEVLTSRTSSSGAEPWRNDQLAASIRRRRYETIRLKEDERKQADNPQPQKKTTTEKTSEGKQEASDEWAAPSLANFGLVFLVALVPVVIASILSNKLTSGRDDSSGMNAGPVQTLIEPAQPIAEERVDLNKTLELQNNSVNDGVVSADSIVVSQPEPEIHEKSEDVLKPTPDINDVDSTPLPVEERSPSESSIVQAWKDQDYSGVIAICDMQRHAGKANSYLNYVQGWAYAKQGRHELAYSIHSMLASKGHSLASEPNPDYALTYLHFAQNSMEPIKKAVEQGRAFDIDTKLVIDAYQWLDWTISLDSRLSEPFALRSLLHETQGSPQSADRDWKRALELGYKTPRPEPLLFPGKMRLRRWFDAKMQRSATASVVEVQDDAVVLEDAKGRVKKTNLLTLSPFDQIWLIEMPQHIMPL